MEPFTHEDSIEIFCSYTHPDQPLRQEFESSVALMRRKKQIELWHETNPAGDRWPEAIDEHLNSADIITLFLSAHFLASDYNLDSAEALFKGSVERQISL